MRPPQGLSVPAINRGSSYYTRPWAVCTLFNILAVKALFEAWSRGKGVSVLVFDGVQISSCTPANA